MPRTPLDQFTPERLEALMEQARHRGRRSLRSRLGRVRRFSWFIAQASLSAGAAWFIAANVFHHYAPVLAPIVAVICLGMSYAQRLRRVAEVTVGVAVGVAVAGLFVDLVGPGGWQIMVVVALGMTFALLLDAGSLLVTQAAVQGIFVAAYAPGEQAGFVRWQDAVIGGGVALVAASIVPAAPLRRPRVEAAHVAQAIADILRMSSQAIRNGDIEGAVRTLQEARNTQTLVRELQEAADDGMSVIASSPFRRKGSVDVRRVADLIEPLERALVGTRLLARRVVGATAEEIPVPASYPAALDLAAAGAEVMSHVLAENAQPNVARPALITAAKATGSLERTNLLPLEVILGQLRSVIVDLLQTTGLSLDEAISSLPPPADPTVPTPA